MATAVQMTITLDANAAAANLNQFKGEMSTLGTQAVSTGAKAKDAFNGIESSERRAHLAGMLWVRTTGVEMPRALETVIARSQIAGPLLASMFPLAIGAALLPVLGTIAEKITNMTEAAAGYTEEVKKIEQETIQASQQAFIKPETLGATMAHLDEVNKALYAIEQQKQDLGKGTDEVQAVPGEDPEITSLRYVAQANMQYAQRNDLEEKGTALEQKRLALLEQEKQQMDSIVISLEDQAKFAGLTGKALIDAQEGQAVDKFNKSFGPQMQQTQEYQRGITAIHAIYSAQRAEIDQSAGAAAAARARQNADATIALQHQVLEDSLQGEDRIKQSYSDEIQNLKRQLDQGLISRKDFNDRSVLYAQQAAQKEAALNDAAEKETETMERKARDASLQGDDLILAHKKDQISATVALYAKGEIDFDQYQRRIVAINQDANAQIGKNDQATAEKRKQVMDQAAEEQKNAEQTVALASVDEWHRAYAQILLEEQNKVAAIDKAERTALQQYQQNDDEYVAIEKAAQAKREAVWAETNQKIIEENKKQVQQLGADLQSVFDDITSGNIGKRILKNFETMFFQILAQWLLTTQKMGSGFGSIFGSLVFGPGSSGANFFGGGASPMGALGGLFGGGMPATTTPPFFPTSATSSGNSSIGGFQSTSGGSTSSSGSNPLGSFLFPAVFGSSSTGLASDGGFSPFGTSSTTSASPLGALSTFMFPGTQSTPASASGALTTQSITQAMQVMNGGAASGAAASLSPLGAGTVGGLFSKIGIAPLAMMGLMALGSKLGGVGQAGAMVTALSLMAAMNPAGPASMFLSGLGAPFAALGPALFGFGIGQQTGPLVGALAGGAAGFGIGALIGMLGGPIGALLGGIIGAISGLFGGLFGGGKRKKAANNYFDQQVAPAIQQIVNAYEAFQLDFVSANSQLEQLRTSAQDQLGKLKGEGNSVFKNKVGPAIDAAEKQLGTDETERNRRAGLVFGPPQFHDGGLVDASVQAWTAKPGEMLAMLKHGEYVVNPVATNKNRGALERMNAGGTPGVLISGGINLYPAQLDQAYIRGQFVTDVLQALTRASNEGKI
ncbi:MAG TPA: hypothetical protein VI636_09355 [Candidatus Angelobacter sp.]